MLSQKNELHLSEDLNLDFGLHANHVGTSPFVPQESDDQETFCNFFFFFGFLKVLKCIPEDCVSHQDDYILCTRKQSVIVYLALKVIHASI